MSASVMQQFDILAQLVASGNIAASARMLGLPPAGIVEAMNALEDRLGFQIFAMADGEVELTNAGRQLVTALGGMALDTQEQWIDDILSRPASTPAVPTDSPIAEAPASADPVAAPAGPPEDPALDMGKNRNQPAEASPVPSGADTGGATAPPQPDRENRDGQKDIAPAPVEKVTPRHFVPQNPKRAAPAAPPPTPKATEPVRTVTLASHPAIFSHFQEALVAFEEASPDIGITMRLAGIGPAEVQDLFEQKLADIVYFYALKEPEGFTSRYAWSERISLFVGEGHPLAKKNNPLAEDLAATPYVALAPGNLARTLTEDALAESGLDVGLALTETDNLYEIMKQVQSSPCYFAAFGPMARDFGKMPGIVRIAWAQGLPQVQVRQAVRDDLSDDPAILALAEFLFR